MGRHRRRRLAAPPRTGAVVGGDEAVDPAVALGWYLADPLDPGRPAASGRARSGRPTCACCDVPARRGAGRARRRSGAPHLGGGHAGDAHDADPDPAQALDLAGRRSRRHRRRSRSPDGPCSRWPSPATPGPARDLSRLAELLRRVAGGAGRVWPRRRSGSGPRPRARRAAVRRHPGAAPPPVGGVPRRGRGRARAPGRGRSPARPRRRSPSLSCSASVNRSRPPTPSWPSRGSTACCRRGGTTGPGSTARADRRRRPRPEQTVVAVDRRGPVLALTLDRPEVRNAYGTRMRDELVAGLQLAAADDSVEVVELRGEGPAFCSGGDLDEFGTADDPVSSPTSCAPPATPASRSPVSPSGYTPSSMGRASAPASSCQPSPARVVARSDATFVLPEVAMGLVPGAGGTASIPRRVGRHRTAHLALSGRPVDAVTALDWGLVDVIDDDAFPEPPQGDDDR